MSDLNPAFETDTAKSQKQTAESFGYKWSLKESYSSPEMKLAVRDWLYKKYFDESIAQKRIVLEKNQKKRILDVGCGAGLSFLSLFDDCLEGNFYTGIDISSAVDLCRENFKNLGLNGRFIRQDMFSLDLSEMGLFDLIFSEGVMHHTPSVANAIKKLSAFLSKDGKFLFYIYKKKAPIREFSDDFIREKLSRMSDRDSWDAISQITELGELLSNLSVTINIPRDISLLEIPAGEHDIQRLFYNYIFKCYFNSNLTFNESNHVNFDWYKPTLCHRHTAEDVNGFLEDADLAVIRLFEDESGISVIAKRR